MQTVELSTVFKESSPTSPLVFVLSQGTDPAADLYKFAEDLKFSKKLTAISLGQGQVRNLCGFSILYHTVFSIIFISVRLQYNVTLKKFHFTLKLGPDCGIIDAFCDGTRPLGVLPELPSGALMDAESRAPRGTDRRREGLSLFSIIINGVSLIQTLMHLI